jgi:predicted amidohydrolase
MSAGDTMMKIRFCRLLLAAVLGTVTAALCQSRPPADNLIRNPDFKVVGEKNLPKNWSRWGPLLESTACRSRADQCGLRMDGAGEPFAVGGVWQEIKGVQGEQAYAVEALCKAESLRSPYRSVIVRITWSRAGKELPEETMMLIRGPVAVEGGLKFDDVIVAPKEADAGRLSLELKWPQGGSVCWKQVSVRPTTPPAPRKVKIGTVYLRPSHTTPERNMDMFCDLVDEAGRLGLDIVCLPEKFTKIGTAMNDAQLAKPIPGPDTERLAAAAKRNHLWVVASLPELKAGRLFNTGVLIDRNGELKGTYRKVHMPLKEWKSGVVPGSEYPVFQTDFGKVAIQICYDWFFPEIAEIWNLKGAEIVFAPTWGTTFPDEPDRLDGGETVFRVRAFDNGIYLVPSVFDGNSMVINPLGKILVSSKGRTGVFWCEVDLNHREPVPDFGHWRAIVPRDRMPDSYGPLLSDPVGPAY